MSRNGHKCAYQLSSGQPPWVLPGTNSHNAADRPSRRTSAISSAFDRSDAIAAICNVGVCACVCAREGSDAHNVGSRRSVHMQRYSPATITRCHADVHAKRVQTRDTIPHAPPHFSLYNAECNKKASQLLTTIRSHHYPCNPSNPSQPSDPTITHATHDNPSTPYRARQTQMNDIPRQTHPGCHVSRSRRSQSEALRRVCTKNKGREMMAVNKG